MDTEKFYFYKTPGKTIPYEIDAEYNVQIPNHKVKDVSSSPFVEALLIFCLIRAMDLRLIKRSRNSFKR